jgi:hypothetical protein
MAGNPLRGFQLVQELFQLVVHRELFLFAAFLWMLVAGLILVWLAVRLLWLDATARR